MLQKLAEGDTRILRPVAPLGGRGATRYELFHDVLAAPILEWRKQHEQRADEERQRAARRRLVMRATAAAVLAAVFAAVAALAFWLLHQQNVSNSHLRAFRRRQLGIDRDERDEAKAAPRHGCSATRDERQPDG